jgi:hypothetical protein
MNNMLEEQVCKQNQQVSFRCAEIAGQQVSGSSSQPQRGEARQDAPYGGRRKYRSFAALRRKSSSQNQAQILHLVQDDKYFIRLRLLTIRSFDAEFNCGIWDDPAHGLELECMAVGLLFLLQQENCGAKEAGHTKGVARVFADAFFSRLCR